MGNPISWQHNHLCKWPAQKHWTLICSLFEQIDEHISYEQFSSNMRKLNHEQWIIIDYLYIYIYKHSSIPLHIFLTRGVGTRKTFTFMCIMRNMLQYYIRQIPNVDPLKPKLWN
jgi:hypothetical protein